LAIGDVVYASTLKIAGDVDGVVEMKSLQFDSQFFIDGGVTSNGVVVLSGAAAVTQPTSSAAIYGNSKLHVLQAVSGKIILGDAVQAAASVALTGGVTSLGDVELNGDLSGGSKLDISAVMAGELSIAGDVVNGASMTLSEVSSSALLNVSGMFDQGASMTVKGNFAGVFRCGGDYKTMPLFIAGQLSGRLSIGGALQSGTSITVGQDNGRGITATGSVSVGECMLQSASILPSFGKRDRFRCS